MAKQPGYDPRVIKQQQELNEAGATFVDILKQMQAAQKQLSRETEATKAEQNTINNLTKDSVSLAQQLSNFSRVELSNKAKRKKFEDTYTKTVNAQKSLQNKINELLKEGTEDSLKRAKILRDQLDANEQIVSESRKLTKEYQKLEKVTGFFEGFENLVKDIPIVRNIFKEITEGSKAAAQNFEKYGKVSKAVFAGARRFGAGGLNALTTAVVTGLVQGLARADKNVVQFTRNLNLSTDAASKVAGELQGLADTAFTFTELSESSVALSTALGTAAPASAESAKQVAILTKRLGLSAQQAADIYRFSTLTGESFKDASNSIVGQVEALNTGAKVTIRYQDVLSDISSASEATLLSTQKFPGGIAKAAFQARKFGLSLASLEKSSSSLLDFQTSIESELEAELLTGKNLNLERARMAALMGDQATLAEEIAKNVGTSEDFTNMNVLAQEALAKSLGMSREELAKTLVQREALLKIEKETGIQDLEKKTRAEQINALTDKLGSKEAALRALGEERLADQERSLTAQEKLAKLLQQIGDQLATIVNGFTDSGNILGDIGKGLDKASGSVNKLANALLALAGLNIFRMIGGFSLLKGIPQAIKGVGSLGKSIASIGKSAMTKIGGKGLGKTLGKVGAKAGGKGLGKLLPGVGLGFAIDAFMRGDIPSGLLNAGAGIASFVPGVGTAIAGGLTAIDIGRDVYKATSISDSSANSLSSTPVVKEAMTIQEESVVLLRRLVQIMEEGGDVYLDGRKVGETLALSYNKLS